MKIKNLVAVVFFITLVIAFLIQITHNYLNDDVDFCLDQSGCWDYNRNRCEFKDQGFCVKDKTDCEVERGGIWDEYAKYCDLNKRN